jgi:hypothetical protein
MVYKWKRNYYPVDAQTAGQELESIEKEYGGIRPEIVVDRSRPEEAVLHGCFDWNDGTAAEKWREQQARVLIGQIVCVRVEESEPEVRAFACVSYQREDEEQENKYVSIEVVLADEGYKKQLYERALRELNSFQKKYRELREFDKIFFDIDELLVQRKIV